MESKRLEEMTKEEVISLVTSIVKKQSEAVKFDMSLVNNPLQLYLPYSEEENKEIYEEYKTRQSKTVFLVKPIFPNLYSYIKEDIENNKLIHEVILLPSIQ